MERRRRRRTRHTVGPCDAGAMTQKPRARLVGINHVALEVGDVEAALALYGRLFEFELRGRAGRMAFVDIGDQFLALAQGRSQAPDQGRHFGLVVDDKEAVRAAVVAEGLATFGRPPALQFLDPWGNRLEIVAYSEVQFERVPAVKRKLGIEALAKTERARAEIAERGLG
jgi:lactoylglutathione lyase